MFVFFFFKQKTAYEMRISDWSSDVCSSDLHYSGWAGSLALAIIVIPVVVRSTDNMLSLVPNTLREAAAALGCPQWRIVMFRSEERRVGKECVSTCRSRWSPYH